MWQKVVAVAQSTVANSAWRKPNVYKRIGIIIVDIFEDASVPSLVLDISLAAEAFLAVYQGRANRILLKSRDGRRVSLPAHHLRPYIGHEGVRGCFQLEFSGDGRLLSLHRLA